MSDKPRFVFDTNTIVSAFLFYHSTPGEALRVALKMGEIIVSVEVLEEIAEVLRREKLDRYLERKTREELLKGLVKQAVVIEMSISRCVGIRKTTNSLNWPWAAGQSA